MSKRERVESRERSSEIREIREMRQGDETERKSEIGEKPRERWSWEPMKRRDSFEKVIGFS